MREASRLTTRGSGRDLRVERPSRDGDHQIDGATARGERGRELQHHPFRSAVVERGKKQRQPLV